MLPGHDIDIKGGTVFLTKRQSQLLDHLRHSIAVQGYAPSLEEIAAHFDLSSVGTVHKHLKALEEKGFIRRQWNRSRAIEIVDSADGRARRIPVVGWLQGGQPIERIQSSQSVAVPDDLIGPEATVVLQVRGRSLHDECLDDGDFVVMARRDQIRDGETAEIAIGAALTGHLVLSTLHNNDAPATVARLVDMGIPSYLVASATKLIMAQRMTRKICENCRREVTISEEHLAALDLSEEERKDLKIYAGAGCPECNQTGLSGRTGIFEVMPISPAIERLILDNASVEEIRHQAVVEGMETLRTAAIKKMKKGEIPLEQVLAEST